jgi:copper chaperone
MKNYTFKTNIKCGGCIAAVTPHLQEAVGEGNWSVDISVPEKILSVTTEKSKEEIIAVVKTAGYMAEAN